MPPSLPELCNRHRQPRPDHKVRVYDATTVVLLKPESNHNHLSSHPPVFCVSPSKGRVSLSSTSPSDLTSSRLAFPQSACTSTSGPLHVLFAHSSSLVIHGLLPCCLHIPASLSEGPLCTQLEEHRPLCRHPHPLPPPAVLAFAGYLSRRWDRNPLQPWDFAAFVHCWVPRF